MKIVLIYPLVLSGEEIRTPLGLASIAAYLRRYGYTDISIIDSRLDRIMPDKMSSIIADMKPDVIGLTGHISSANYMHAIAPLLKKKLPDSKIVIGGPYATNEPERALSDKAIDYVVRGEGEEQILSLIRTIEKADFSALHEIKGIGFKEGSRVLLTSMNDMILHPDELPFPAWDLVDLERYWKYPHLPNIYSYPRYTLVETSRGCPYDCPYCVRVFNFNSKRVVKSPDRVMAELKWLHREFDIKDIHISDKAFNYTLDREKEIFRKVIDSGLDFRFNFYQGLFLKYIDEEFVDLAKKAGTYMISIGIQTANKKLACQYKRDYYTVDDAYNTINMIADKGIQIQGHFMLGFPGETEEMLRETIDSALKSNLHVAHFFNVTPFPHTQLHETAESENKELPIDPDLFSIDKNLINVSEIPDNRFKSLKRYAYLRFYLNPVRMWRLFKVLPKNWRVLINCTFFFLHRTFGIKPGARV